MAYELDVEEYNDVELMNIIDSSQDITKINELKLGKTIAAFKSKILGANPRDNTDTTSLILFADKIHDKLLSYVQRRSPVQLPPMNYNVLQSQNQLSGGAHMVTTDKIVQPINTSEYKYPAGVMNPLEKRTFTKVINIDSAFRKNYEMTSSNRFQWTLEQPETKVVSMKLVSVELPIMWYDISEKNKNNTFTITLRNLKKYPGDRVHIISIPSGNYSHSEMIDTINHLFINKRGGLEYIKVHIDDITTKTTIRVINPKYDTDYYTGLNYLFDDKIPAEYSPDFECQVDFFSLPISTNSESIEDISYRKCLGWYIGFRKPSYTVRYQDTILDSVSVDFDHEITYHCSLTSESSFGSGKGHYIYIAVDDYNRNCLTETISSKTSNHFVGNNLLGRISIDTPSQEIMITTPADRIFRQRDYMGPVTLTRMTIELLNRFGDLIDLNNNDFSLALELTVLY